MRLLATIEMLSYWHAGTGLGLGVVADAATLKNSDQLPYLPGKTIKGLFKEAFNILEESGKIPNNTTQELFGEKTDTENTNDIANSGCTFFSNGNLSKNLADELKNNPQERECLYETIAQTKLNDQGIAVNKSLRTIEVCLPVTMFSIITYDRQNPHYEEYFNNAAKLIRNLGSHRNRGLGRCQIRIARAD